MSIPNRLFSALRLTLLGIALAYALPIPSRAEVFNDLYQGRAIVTGQGEETRGPGLSKAFVDVLVKVGTSGNSLSKTI